MTDWREQYPPVFWRLMALMPAGEQAEIEAVSPRFAESLPACPLILAR